MSSILMQKLGLVICAAKAVRCHGECIKMRTLPISLFYVFQSVFYPKLIIKIDRL